MKETVLSLVLLLPAASGCVRQAMQDVEIPTDRTAEDSPPRSGDVQEIILADDEPAEEEASEPAGAATPSSGERHPSPESPEHHPLPQRRPSSEPVLFRLGAGYGALGRLDLAPCREQGLPPGYLHMRVTFRQSGRVVRAAVETSAPPPREALACISERLELAMVPVFEGGDVTLSKSFFVN